jgi:hypothetical protein
MARFELPRNYGVVTDSAPATWQVIVDGDELEGVARIDSLVGHGQVPWLRTSLKSAEFTTENRRRIMGHSETHKTLHRLFNERDFDGLDEYVSQDITYDDIPRGLTMKNRDEFKDWLRGWVAAFSDARVDSVTYLEGPDFSLARFRGRGRNDGAMGPLPATNREMYNPFWELMRYNEDGIATSAEIQYDQLTLLVQLGHMQSPG